MSVKGSERQPISEKKLYTGLTTVEVKAFNPSKKELNKLLGIDDKEDDKEILYSSQDADGNERQRMTFWLKSEDVNQYFVHSFLLTKKDRTNKDGSKVQIINSTCDTTWVPLKDGKMDEDVIPDWFGNFTSKEKGSNEVKFLGKKTFRKSVSGEEELGILLKAWLGKLNWRDADTEVVIDTDKLFKEKYGEVRELIDGNYSTPFVALIGVRTDETDTTKKYQQVYAKSFLPNNFLNQVKKNKFTEWGQKVWNKFNEEVTGEYGAQFYVELVPIKEYDEENDITASNSTKKDVAANSSDY